MDDNLKKVWQPCTEDGWEHFQTVEKYLYMQPNPENCPLQIKHSDTRQSMIRRYIVTTVAESELRYYKISTQWNDAFLWQPQQQSAVPFGAGGEEFGSLAHAGFAFFSFLRRVFF